MTVEKTTCAYVGCKNAVTEEDFCHGCKQYVCEAHSPFMTWGGHDVSAHWDQEDDDDDDSGGGDEAAQ